MNYTKVESGDIFRRRASILSGSPAPGPDLYIHAVGPMAADQSPDDRWITASSMDEQHTMVSMTIKKLTFDYYKLPTATDKHEHDYGGINKPLIAPPAPGGVTKSYDRAKVIIELEEYLKLTNKVTTADTNEAVQPEDKTDYKTIAQALAVILLDNVTPEIEKTMIAAGIRIHLNTESLNAKNPFLRRAINIKFY